MFIFISGAVNNDNLTMTLCSLGLLLIVKRVREYEGSGIRDQQAAERELPFAQDFFYRFGRWLPLGIVLGPGRVDEDQRAGAAADHGIGGHASWRGAKDRGASSGPGAFATALPVLLIAGWWYLRNVQLYGDVTGISAFIDVLGKRAAPASLLQLWGERWGFMLSYWGLFGGVNVPLDDWGYHVLNGLAVLAVIGVIVYFVTMTWQWFRADPIHSWRDFRHELRDYIQGRAALFLVGLVWSDRRGAADAVGARHVVIARPPGLLGDFDVVDLLRAGVGDHRHEALCEAVHRAGGRVHVCRLGPRALHDDCARLRAACAVSLAVTPQIPLDVTFGDQLKLIGADVTSSSAQPGGQSEIVLYWQALKPIEKDYSTFVHLLDANDIVVAQRDMYPGQGLWPTSQMKPGDIIASRYVLNLPATAYAPDQLKWEVGVYDFATQQRLPASSGGDNVRFGSVELSGSIG